MSDLLQVVLGDVEIALVEDKVALLFLLPVIRALRADGRR